VSAKSTSNSPASKQRRRGFDHWQLAAKTVVIVVAVGLAYLPALRAGFVWDDEPLITANPLLQSFSGLAEIWWGARTADYFPLTNTIFWIESHLFGGHAAGYHALNILLQSANALLVWAVLRRLEIPGAWLAGLIFGIHPVHAESVAWISELKNLLSMFFFLVSLLCFFEIEERRIFSGSVAYVASLFFFLLALLSKTQVVFLPVVLLLCAWWRRKWACRLDCAHRHALGHRRVRRYRLHRSRRPPRGCCAGALDAFHLLAQRRDGGVAPPGAASRSKSGYMSSPRYVKAGSVLPKPSSASRRMMR